MTTPATLIIAGERREPRSTQTAARALAPVRDTPPTPAEMLDAAVRSGASIETMEKLIALQERWEANNARKAFDAAISAAKAVIPRIVKDKQGDTNRYATFANIAAKVDPVLAENGLSYRFRTAQADKITVTCILSHRDGHSEETTLCAPPDTGPRRNPIQAIGSTLSYLQRYSLIQALGLAVADDDDGKAAGGDAISDEQVAALRRAIIDTDSDLPAFLKFLRVERLEDLPAKDFDRAAKALDAKKRKGPTDAR